MSPSNKIKSPPTAQRHPSRGIALIEALVAILIFTVGILGAVGLQAAMLRTQGAAKVRADAAILASEVVGMMWTDAGSRANLQNYTSDCTTGSCGNWMAKLGRSLPNGTATFALSNVTGATTITITWTPPNDVQHQFVTSTAATACLIATTCP